MTIVTGLSTEPARVLVVDDEPRNRLLLEVMLAPEGYNVRSASSGEEALFLLAQFPFDLILLDVMMPEMDGFELATRLKADVATKHIPIVMLTALDGGQNRIMGLNAGAEDFLTKPVDRAELCLRVRNLLRLKAYADHHEKYNLLLEEEVRKRTAALAESEELYRSTFEAAPVGIVHISLEGVWLRVNGRICQMLGYECKDLEMANVQALLEAEFLEGEAAALSAMVAGMAERHVVDEKRYRRADGSSLWVRVNTSLHRDAEGEPQYYISVLEDISERMTLETQIRQAGKMDAIGRLASGVAHDFNNLLTVIQGYAEFISGDHEVSAAHGEDLAEILKASARASALTKQLLAFGRQQVLHSSPLDTNMVITEMVVMLRRLIGENIETELLLGPELPMALADRSQLEQVVMNLVVNARDALPAGGKITIETSRIELENSAFHDQAIEQGTYVMIAVSDDGVGMDKETQQHVFEPFFTTKAVGAGTGLGLSTTYGIIKQSKGYIWVYSERGTGSTFKVFLPSCETPATPTAVPVPELLAAAAAGPLETVLLVEDEAGVRQLSHRILVNAGYRVLVAVDGNQAEQLYLAHAEAIDLVVTDMVMPGCGGPELLRRLRAREPGLRALYMSGYTEQAVAHKAGINGSAPFVQKPFTAAELVRQVRAAL